MITCDTQGPINDLVVAIKLDFKAMRCKVILFAATVLAFSQVKLYLIHNNDHFFLLGFQALERQKGRDGRKGNICRLKGF